MKTIKNTLILVAFTILGVSCSKNNPVVVNSEEVITTLTLTLTPQGGGSAITLKSYDLDGTAGPNSPVITVSGNLAASTTYIGEIKVLNETESPAEDVTVEVKTEGDKHEFFYATTIAGLAITKTDVDANNNPIGIETSLATGAAGSGTLTIILKHSPTKPNNGTDTGAGGSTDVEAKFTIQVI